MIPLTHAERRQLEPLFLPTENTMILSYLEGHMGRGYWTGPESACGCIAIGDFRFFAGDPEAPGAGELLDAAPSRRIVFPIPSEESWRRRMQLHYGKRAQPATRYAFHKDSGGFRPELLSLWARALPPGGELVPLSTCYAEARSEDWSTDLVSQFGSAEEYARRGLGFGLRLNGVLVSGASSYTIYNQGIEIEIDTRPGFWRRGYAAICASRLILECLSRGLYPSWDAANPASKALAEKLGYRFSHAYPAFRLYPLGE